MQHFSHFRFPRLIPAISFIFLLSSCDTPTITSLDPSEGSEGMVVVIDGTDQLFADVNWDGSEIPTFWYGAIGFTIPYGTATGSHEVTLSNSYGTSAAATCDVNPAVTIPAPDINDVQLVAADIASGAFTQGVLLVVGSNIDIGATINIDGTDVTSGTHQVLINNFCGGVDPQSFGSPNYHYTSVITSLIGLTPGSTISVQIVNLDGETSSAFSYDLGASNSLLDSDGDGLLDDWEENGYDADGDGTIDVDLASMGCSKYHKDILIEVDIMNGLSNTPASTMWASVEQTFANAPVLNGDGEPGINILIDRGQGGSFTEGGVTITYYEDIDFSQATSTSSGAGNNLNFYDAKTANFDNNRLRIFRYCLWGETRFSSSSSGRAENTPSNDFLVGMDTYPSTYTTDLGQSETFVHELGHTLGFGHGGPAGDNLFDEPNHLSVMSYCWQFLTAQADCITCTDCYTSYSPGYSEGMAADLDETNLDETVGICDGVGIDWNGNSVMETGISANINPDDGTGISVLDDYDEWHNIVFDFTAVSGWGSD